MSRRFYNEGFSLIEIMVAMSILVIIVMIMSQLFHQSTIAWDSGMRKAEGNLSARAVVGFMSRELQGGVLLGTNHPGYKGGTSGEIADGADAIKFFTLTGTNSTDHRILKRIEYKLVGGKIQRSEQTYSADGSYGTPDPVNPKFVDLIDKVYSLQFETPDAATYTESMPAWVKIKIGMSRTDDVSGIKCMSAGPDRKFNTTNDNIVSN